MTTVRFLAVLAYSGALVALARPERATAPAGAAPQPRSSLALAAQVLGEAEDFSAAQVGYAGVTPPEVLAWRVVLRSDQADSVFRGLIRSGARPAQLYALAGLQFLVQVGKSDSAAYRQAVRRIGRSRELVGTQIGCVGSTMPLDSLVRQIDAGLWTREFIAGRLLRGH